MKNGKKYIPKTNVKETEIASSFLNVDFTKIYYPMIVIYKNPADMPEHDYVCRLWEGTTAKPTNIVIVRSSLAACRHDIEMARPEMLGFPREETDDLCIIETWF